MGVHGGTDETSMMLHLAPDLVDMTAAAPACPRAPRATNRYVRFGGPVAFGWLSNDFADDGVIGDPTAADAEHGARAVRRRRRRLLRRARRDRHLPIPAVSDADDRRVPRDVNQCTTSRVDGDAAVGGGSWPLGEIGAIEGPNGEHGCARLALTDADREGRDLVVGWMRDLGLAVAIDAIGNVVATRPGTDPRRRRP